MLEIREEIRTSKGYQVLIAMLDSYFGQDYIIRKITYDDLDPTSFDFQLSVDFPKLKGVDIGVGNSGPRQMFRMGGNGSINITIPKKDGISILTSGEKGDGLIRATNSECLRWRNRIDNLEEVKYYFDVFKKYYDNL
ncbi:MULTISPECIES: hypothetical protein [Streptococcus]|uniref:hypothetical protein n=1 Tax=Streptococcus TaxID=1301 RepID=UPI0001E0988E|nr:MULTISPECIES: hypothetical protein [Streptococcus]EFM28721.1 hypothetical protein HMPREF9352_1882 [Streptococcus gallolyticus subsp. gallolyticus TX20005]QKI00450.1 hypothetical protein FOC63_02350 [Streptococcus gallolyticus]QWX86518.1 hypothetical protein JGX27_09725 [Streptococcus gallolyticus subsp. gallolyticus TX20005]SEK88055.1 hypothetical protein SAMN05216373_1150 [Streptococcus equinus]